MAPVSTAGGINLYLMNHIIDTLGSVTLREPLCRSSVLRRPRRMLKLFHRRRRPKTSGPGRRVKIVGRWETNLDDHVSLMHLCRDHLMASPVKPGIVGDEDHSIRGVAILKSGQCCLTTRRTLKLRCHYFSAERFRGVFPGHISSCLVLSEGSLCIFRRALLSSTPSMYSHFHMRSTTVLSWPSGPD